LASPEGPPEEKAHIYWAVVVSRGSGGTPRRTIPDISIHDIPTKPRTEQIKTGQRFSIKGTVLPMMRSNLSFLRSELPHHVKRPFFEIVS